MRFVKLCRLGGSCESMNHSCDRFEISRFGFFNEPQCKYLMGWMRTESLTD